MHAFKKQSQAQDDGAAVAESAREADEPQEDDPDPMDCLLPTCDEKPVKDGSAKKKAKVLGRLVYVRAREQCPLAFPQSTDTREVALISFKVNEYWVRVGDVPWLFERLRSENDLAGVPLIDNPDDNLAAVAASASGSDSQGSAVATDSQDPEIPQKPAKTEAESAQGTEDVGYTCRWLFPSKGDLGGWEATVTRAGDLHGKVVSCQVAKFTRVKWLNVYRNGPEAPCQWHKATPLHKKEACKLYLEAHMSSILSEPPAGAS